MSQATQEPAQHILHAPTQRDIVAVIVRRLVPFLCLIFLVNYLDRTNVAMAKLAMLKDTGISESQYGYAAGFFFFIGYFIFEVPSNLILERVGARIWITRIMVSWGLICSALMFAHNATSFYILRFLLGVAEAGFFPGIVLYLTYWIPSSRRAGVLAAFLISTAVSGLVGNPLAGLLMKMDGLGGLHGWQWLFVIEGLMPISLGAVTFVILPDKPKDAKWLSADEVNWIEAELSREHVDHHGHHVAELKLALRDHRLWLLGVIYFMLIMGLYGFIFWVPTIVKSAGTLTNFQVGLISAIPFLVAAVSMVLIGRHADHKNERRAHVATCAIVAAIGMAIISQCHTVASVIPALCFAAIGIFGSLGPFWALSTRFLKGTAAAGGIAIVNSIGACAGMVAPSAVGWAKERYNSFTYGLLLVSAALVCGAVLVMLVPKRVDRAMPN
ncbi:MAG TPA: MFS transporter [Tepidisphaeraceae bacterium]|jgi:MFS family permease|nr:MFS transporter [Tepidisphaeraceae bacterium]